MDISALKLIRQYVTNAPTPYVGGVKGRVCLSEKEFIEYLLDTEIGEIENLPGRWRSVEDGLPEYIGAYLIYFIEELSGVIAWSFFNSDKKWAIPSCGFYQNVTHWMPLPEPPK